MRSSSSLSEVRDGTDWLGRLVWPGVLQPPLSDLAQVSPHTSHLTPHSSRLNLGLLSVRDITGPQFCHLVNIGRGQRAEIYNVGAQYRDKKPLQLYQLLLANVNLNLITHRKHFQRGYFPVSVMLWCPTLFTHVWGPIIEITHKYLLSYSYFIVKSELFMWSTTKTTKMASFSECDWIETTKEVDI